MGAGEGHRVARRRRGRPGSGVQRRPGRRVQGRPGAAVGDRPGRGGRRPLRGR